MKKLFLVLICLFSFAVLESSAQLRKFDTTDFAYRYINDSGSWTSWSDWEDCSLLITLDFSKKKIAIYSDGYQEFRVTSYSKKPENDTNGGQQIKLSCIDEDGKYCTIRLRTEKSGNKQLYVDYSDLMYVYNVRERKNR